MSFLDDAIRSYHESQRRVFPCHTNRASSAGIECHRRLLWQRTRWQDAAMPDLGLQRAFDLGRMWEPVIARWLEDGGIEIEQRQRDLSWAQFQLTGHIDGIVRLRDLANQKAVLEIKTTSRFSFEAIRRAESAAALLMDRRSYVRGYVVQAALYALLLGLRLAFLLFVNKDNGETHTIEVSLDDDAVLAAAEAALKRLETVNAAIAEGRDLPAEPSEVCRSCPFLGACAPARDFGPGLNVIEDDDLAAMLSRREELAAAVRERDEIDKALKERFTSAGEALVGDWHVVVKEQVKNFKAQAARTTTELRRSYERVAAQAAPATEEAA